MPSPPPVSDPIIAAVQKWREAKRKFEEGPQPERFVGIDQAYGDDVVYMMRHAPVAQSAEGAIAALETALEEAAALLPDSMNGALIRSALGFLRKYQPPIYRPATRAELEAYREWLDMEARLLGAELFPECGSDAHRYVPSNTGIHDLHFGAPGMAWKDIPQPSSRALAVLSAIGANFHEIQEWRLQPDRGAPTRARTNCGDG